MAGLQVRTKDVQMIEANEAGENGTMALDQAGNDDMAEANAAIMAEVHMSTNEASQENVSELSSSNAMAGVTSDDEGSAIAYDEGSASTTVESASSKMGTSNVSSFLPHSTYSNVLCIFLQ